MIVRWFRSIHSWNKWMVWWFVLY